MAIKKSKAKKAVKRGNSAKKKFVCTSCGTEVVMTECGPEFTELICCGTVMGKK